MFYWIRIGRVRKTTPCFLKTFDCVGSASGVAAQFRKRKLAFPRRSIGEPEGEIVWGELQLSQALRTLRNPRYAGTFFFGRTRCRKSVSGVTMTRLPMDQWHTVIPNAHPGTSV